ncbi:MAG: CPBP family intramembrane metalloprotease [Saprospiraceae bacterium]|nr:CPBP family intramembrane metalloprotease [Saprospiraceae bacterium]
MFTRPILRYLAIAFGFTWVVAFVILFLHHRGFIGTPIRDLLHALPALGPAIGAFFVIPDRRYWARCLRFTRTKPVEWLIVLSPLLFLVVGLFVFRISKSQAFNWGQFLNTTFASPLLTINFFLPLFTYGFFEEIGWRGFLLPQLQQHFNAWKSTFLLTIIWGIWHLPFFFYRFEFSWFISIGFFFGLWIGAIILTHLLNQNRGILWFGVAFHFLNNLASAIEKEITVMVLSVGFMVLALWIVWRFGRTNLSTSTRYTASNADV